MTSQAANDLSAFGRHAPRGWLAGLVRAARRCGTDWPGRRLAFALRAVGVPGARAAGRSTSNRSALACGSIPATTWPRRTCSSRRNISIPRSAASWRERARRGLHLRRRRRQRRRLRALRRGAGGPGRPDPGGRAAGRHLRAPDLQHPAEQLRHREGARTAPWPTGTATSRCSSIRRTRARPRCASSAPHGPAPRCGCRPRRCGTIWPRRGFDRLDCVKLDVEGAEDLILEAFFRDAPRRLWPRLLIVEDAPGRWAIDLPALIAGAGLSRSR